VTTLVAAMAALDFRLTGLGPGATISEQIRRRRLKQGWSLERLAERTGLSRTINGVTNNWAIIIMLTDNCKLAVGHFADHSCPLAL